MFLQRDLQHLRILDRHRPDDDGGYPKIEHPSDIVTGAESAAHLHRNVNPTQDFLNTSEIFALPPERTIKIDQVQPLRPGYRKTFGDRSRVVVVHRLVLFAALQQPHAAALTQINGRKDQHSSSKSSKGAKFQSSKGAKRGRRVKTIREIRGPTTSNRRNGHVRDKRL